MIYIKIAFRNLWKNKKRTLLIGLTLVISCTFLLMSYAIGNGIGRQILERYRGFQSGDVTAVWDSVKEIDVSDPSRLYFSEYDLKKDTENRAAIGRMDEFLARNQAQLAGVYKTVSGNGMLDTGKYASYSIIYGLAPDELAYLQREKLFELVAGDVPFGYEYGVCLSDEMAHKYGVRLGDWVILDSDTAQGYVNTLDYQVVGFYKSSSEYDSIYVYMARENALELFDQSPEYFKVTRIYLKNPAHAEEFTRRLDAYLTEKSSVLRAESISYNSQFFSTIAGFQKQLFSFFVVFILFIIAIGIRSAVRMSLFERMREFGTLRAMGFNRRQNFLIVFYEIFLLSLMALAIAFVLNLVLVLLLSRTGIHIGKGAIAYALGGESIYPVFVFGDMVQPLVIITLFSLFAPLKPGLRLCYQRITDLLAQDQKPISALGCMLRNAFSKKRSGKSHPSISLPEVTGK